MFLPTVVSLSALYLLKALLYVYIGLELLQISDGLNILSSVGSDYL